MHRDDAYLQPHSRPQEGSAATAQAAAGTPSIEFYRQLVEGMTCGVLTIDCEGIVTTLNDHAREILELDRRDALGMACEQVLDRCPRLAQLLVESFSMSAPPSRAEMEIPLSGRRRRTIGFSISMIGTPTTGRIEGAALFFKDLTRVEEQEERDRLRDRLAALGAMAAQMAHEIRNPLTSIQVSAELMQRKLAARGEPTDLLQKIGAEVGRIETSIANCLEYARPISPDLHPADPAALLEEAIAIASLRAGYRGVAVERAYAPGGPQILCDRALIVQSLINILVNAYEAIGNSGAITVAAECGAGRAILEDAGQSERFVFIRITDTGPGIPPEFLDRIFFPFFTTKTSGSGIGLAMARKVVESHGGWLDVDSEPGRGTTFTLKLPRVEARINGNPS